MSTITKAQRAAIKAHIDEQTDYDASTMRISRDGIVSAKLDANKIAYKHRSTNSTARLDVGSVESILAEIAA